MDAENKLKKAEEKLRTFEEEKIFQKMEK